MTAGHRSARATHAVVDRAAGVVVSAVGHAAGATVAPGTALTKLRGVLLTPGVLAAAAAAVAAYLLGRRGARVR